MYTQVVMLLLNDVQCTYMYTSSSSIIHTYVYITLFHFLHTKSSHTVIKTRRGLGTRLTERVHVHSYNNLIVVHEDTL